MKWNLCEPRIETLCSRRKILGQGRNEGTGAWSNCKMKNLMQLTDRNWLSARSVPSDWPYSLQCFYIIDTFPLTSHLASTWANSYALKMEAVCFFKMLQQAYYSTCYKNPDCYKVSNSLSFYPSVNWRNCELIFLITINIC